MCIEDGKEGRKGEERVRGDKEKNRRRIRNNFKERIKKGEEK